MRKQYYLSWSYIFNLINNRSGIRKPWVIKCEGSYDTWIFPTEQDAKDWISKQGDGDLCGIDIGEKELWDKEHHSEGENDLQIQ